MDGDETAPSTDSRCSQEVSTSLIVASPAITKPVKRFVRQQVPSDILENTMLNEAISVLPQNYNFEIHKTIWRLRQANAKAVALQFPEGLLLFAMTIADILEKFAGVEHTFILGDVTYGACCIDDFSAAALGADFLVHYGHSCLVPVDTTTLPCLYVFVDILIDVQHVVDTIKAHFQPMQKIALAGTIQFSSGIQGVRQALQAAGPGVMVPQVRPLSPGETLGCTAPVIAGQVDAIVFLADGRFHLEAIMIANPTIPAYRYDPYNRTLYAEKYDQEGMREARRDAVERARGASQWGIILGTLGRQGNPALFDTVSAELQKQGKQCVHVLMSEVSPQKLALFQDQVEAWVQVACPRLSIDWGEGFKQPTLSSYEALVALGVVPGWWEQEEGAAAIPIAQQPYPMDYYSRDGGVWNSSYHKKKPAPVAPVVQPLA